jgi:acetyl esterase
VTDWFALWPDPAPGGLDPKVRAALDAQPAADFRSLGPAAVRAEFSATAARVPKPHEPLAAVENLTIGDGVRIRLYRPEGKGLFPVLLYFHGGGWVVGDLDTHDHVCRSLARRGNALVVNVDYRLAPEKPFPIPLDDCETALDWAVDHARDFGGDPSRLAAGGDSAGGNLAIGLALRAPDRIRLQLLIYPVTDRNFETTTYREFASGYGLTRGNMQWFWECYYPRAELDPSVAPLRAASLKGLPPAFVLTAEYDVLRDEGEAYARRLHKEGVAVRGMRFLGMNHGFIRMAAVYPQAEHALSVLAEALKQL